VPGFGYDGLKGFSILSYMRDSVGVAISADKVASEAFVSSGKAQGALLFKGKLSIDQRQNLFKVIREQADEYNRNGGFLVLDEGTDIKPFHISPEDMQMLENRRYSVEDVCRWFRVPPHMVGHSNVTTWGSGIEELSRGFISLTLQPTYLSRIQSALNKRLLPLEMQSDYYFEFKVQALIRANIIGQAAYYSTMLQNGVYSRNEVRGFMNMPPVEGGDEYTVQVNLTLLEELKKMAAEEEGYNAY
jgi:HK97 family phage portal protein